MGSEKNIYILTNFQQFLKSYSPLIIAQGQVEMLLDHGYQPVLFANEGWNPPESSVFSQIRSVHLKPVVIDGQEVDDKFEQDVDDLYEQMMAEFQGKKEIVVLTHDLIFLPDYVKLNVASRRVAETRPDILWLHWVHSATNPNDLIKERSMFAGKYADHLADKFPNSLVCFPNAYDIPRVALNFDYEENEVVEVPHPTNAAEGMNGIVQRLYKQKKLYESQVLMIYPSRLDRGKCVEAMVWFMYGLKENGLTSHAVICDFHSTGGDKVVYREELKELALSLGVEDRLTFLSEFDKSVELEAPHDIILDLFTLSNVFALPSKSETYSLIAQEAALRKNLCILNQDFGPFRQIFGKGALYKQFFGANIAFSGMNGNIDTKHEPIENHFKDITKAVAYYLENNPVLFGNMQARTRRNPDYIFEHYIEPLFSNENKGDWGGKIYSDHASLLGARTPSEWRFGPAPLQGQDSPESD